MTLFVPSLVVLCGAAAAAGTDYDPAEVLRRVFQKVQASFNHTPRYTCVETVTRDFFQPEDGTVIGNPCSYWIERSRSDLRYISTDRLRLEVTMSRKGEIYSWLGASKFNEGDITNLIKFGPIATGAFGTALAAVFHDDARNLVFQREVTVEGRRLLEYSFEMDAKGSTYRVRTLLNGWIFSGYHGTVLLDPASNDLFELSIVTAELPPVTGSCQTVTTMDFARQKIGNAVLLLPSRTRSRFIGSTGSEAENTVTFSSCREYQADSTVTFFAEPGQAGNPRTKSAGARLSAVPAGLRLSMTLASQIVTDTAAAGDPFRARLAEPLLNASRHLLAPRNALIEGRVLQVRIAHLPTAGVSIVLHPQTLEIDGVKVPVAAYRESPRSGAGREIVLPQFWEPHSGIFEFRGEHLTIGAGYRSEWRTTAAGAH